MIVFLQDKKTSNNSSPNSNEMVSVNPVPPKLANSMITTPNEIDNNKSSEVSLESMRNNNPRTRRNPNLQNPQHDETGLKKVIQEEIKISQNHEIKISQNQEIKISQNQEKKLHNEELDAKSRAKSWNQSVSNTLGKSEKLTKALNPKEQTHLKSNQSRFAKDNSDNKKPKEQNSSSKSEKEQKSSETQKKNHSRPAVILLDETTFDNSRNSDSSELTFGFEINEQLLLSDDSEETSMPSPVFLPRDPPFNKPPPNFSQPPPMFTKHVKVFDKFSPNSHPNPGHPIPQPIPIAHMQATQNVAHVFRFHHPPIFMRPPPAVPPTNVNKYINLPKEDFSARYIAPESEVDVENYNHDKIVTFVGLGGDFFYSLLLSLCFIFR